MGTSDNITLQSEYNINTRIENFVFTDATFTYNDIISRLVTNGTDNSETLNGSSYFSEKIYGLGGNDTITGGYGGNDSLYGGDENDKITGSSGNDYLDGGTGADTMIGSTGNDTYYVDNIGDIVTENTSAGTDTVNSSISYTLGINVENLTLTGTENINGTGNILNNIITGNSGNNIVNGGSGSDTMIGGTGNDTYYVDNVGDIVVENLDEGIDLVNSNINYTLGDNLENLLLELNAGNINGTGNDLDNAITGNAENNILEGKAGSDTLIGAIGIDTMIGGTGNDTYYVDNAADVIIENLNEGTDTVISNISYTLGDNLENLLLELNAGNINGTGNDLDNAITGNAENNILEGKAGSDTLIGAIGIDTMIGGIGNDIYYVDNSGDVITENSNEGSDTVNSSTTYTLDNNVENLNLTGASNINGAGNSLNNIITGNSGNNILDGSSGADTMIGGAGNDTYYVDNTGDAVTENLNEGTDTVNSSITYTLGSNIENLTLTGSSSINGTGNTLNNAITGNSGNNVLDGSSGADTMIGGAGNDTYYVDNAGDIVTENAYEGTDTVQSSVSYTLGANLENLVLTGTSNINATGNTLDNTITGNSGNNILTGDSGNDTYNFSAGFGNDTISDTGGTDNINFSSEILRSNVNFVKDVNDLNITITGSSDQIKVQNWFLNSANKIETVSFANDSSTMTSSQIDALFNQSTGDTITGTSGNDVLTGTNGNDSIIALGGNDTITGGTGNDTIDSGYNGAGADVYNFNLGDGQDVINDYSYVYNENDKISFGSGITQNDLYVTASGNNLILKINGTQDQITIKDYYLNSSSSPYNKIEQFYFSQTATTLTTTDIENMVIIEGTASNDTLNGTAANDTIYGYAGNDFIVAGAGNDTITGGTGNDTIDSGYNGAGADVYNFNLGDGQDVINDFSSVYNENDKISFGSGITQNDLYITKSGII